MQRNILIIFALALVHFPASAGNTSFGTIEEYLSTLVEEKIETEKISREVTSDREHVFGMAQWPCRPQDHCDSGTHYMGYIFVLKKLQNGRLQDVAHSTPPFRWPETTDGVGFEETISKRSDSFTVSFHYLFSGNVNFTFAYRSSNWILAGIDCDFIWMEDGDEAIGDSGSNKSANLLTGHLIETRYKNNKQQTKKEEKISIHPIALSKFTPDLEELSICP